MEPKELQPQVARNVSPLSRPVVWGPLALGTGGLIGYFLLHHPVFFLSLSILSFLVFGVSFFVFALARKGLEAERQQKLGLDSDEEQARKIKRLLGRARYEESTAAPAERAVEQVDQAVAKMKAFKKILKSKFDSREFTYSRYSDSAGEVFLSVLASLGQVSDLLTGMAPLKSGEVFDSQKREVERRLDQNEKGLAALDEVIAALSRVDTGRGLASQDLESALAQLQELAARAGKYSKEEGR